MAKITRSKTVTTAGDTILTLPPGKKGIITFIAVTAAEGSESTETNFMTVTITETLPGGTQNTLLVLTVPAGQTLVIENENGIAKIDAGATITGTASFASADVTITVKI